MDDTTIAELAKLPGEVIEVRLVKPGRLVIRAELSTDDDVTRDVPVRAVQMRGAQREMVSALRPAGWAATGRWEYDAATDCTRLFRLVLGSRHERAQAGPAESRPRGQAPASGAHPAG